MQIVWKVPNVFPYHGFDGPQLFRVSVVYEVYEVKDVVAVVYNTKDVVVAVVYKAKDVVPIV